MPDISMGQMFNEAADARQKFYDIEQKNKLRDIFSQHINTKGDLDENKFYQAVQDAGLDDAHAATAMSWAARKKAAQNNTAELNWNMRTLGTDPSAAPRNNAPRGGPSEVPQIVSGTDSSGRAGADPFDPTTPPVETKPVATAPAPESKIEAAAPPAQQPGSATATGEEKPKWDINDWFSGLKGTSGALAAGLSSAGAPAAPKWNINDWFQQSKTPVQAPAAGPAESAVPPTADNGQVAVRAGNTEARGGEEGKLPLPPVSNAQYAVQPDNRSSEQIVEDSFDPSKVMGMPGANGGASGKQYFQVDQTTTPDALQTIATGLQRNGLLGNDASPVAINAALQKAQDADYAALGPAPGPQLNKEGKYDRTATMNAFREYQAKYAGVYKDWVGKYGKEYADQLSQKIAADNNARATVQLNNDVDAKNAGAKGMNDFAARLSAQAEGLGSSKLPLDPTKFTNVAEMQKMNARLAAFKSINENPKSLEDIVTNAKNVAVAEGLSETEGTSRMLQMLGASGLSDKLQVALAHGAQIDAKTLAAIGALGYLQGGALDFKSMKKQMALNKEIDALRMPSKNINQQPTLSGYRQEAPKGPSQADLAKTVANLGTKMNPYPVGQEPPVGAYYTHSDGTIRQRSH